MQQYSDPLSDRVLVFVSGADQLPVPARSPSGLYSPLIVFDDFEGPLDLLVSMAREHKIDLTPVSILGIVDQFDAALRAAIDDKTSPLPRLADWLVMMAWIAYLKSLLFLGPRDLADPDAVAGLEALARAAQNRAFVQAATAWLDARPCLGRDVFAWGRAEDPAAAARDAGVRGEGDVADTQALFEACLVAMNFKPGSRRRAVVNPVYAVTPLQGWSPAEARDVITDWLASSANKVSDQAGPVEARAEPLSLWALIPDKVRLKAGWSTTTNPAHPVEESLSARATFLKKSVLASMFLAGLEFAKTQEVVLEQENDRNVYIRRPSL